MLLLQGTADELGTPDDINEMVASINGSTSLQFVASAGHGFSAPNRRDQDVYVELATATAAWTAELV